MSKIAVSVIMPVYNSEKYLRVALDSLINSTLKNIEIICVDDGSTDSSFDILKEYKQKDNRFILLRQKNSYAGVARNYGMSVAKGKYLSFLDSDDYFKTTMLEEAYLCAEKEQADLVVFGGEYFSEDISNAYHVQSLLNEELLPEGTVFDINNRIENLLHFTTPCPWNKLFLRKFVEKYNLKFQEYKRANDIYFVELALAYASKIAVVRKDLICYRTGNNQSLQGTNSDSPLQFVNAFLSVKEKLIEQNIYNKYEKSFRNICLSNCIYYLESIKEGKAFIELYEALKERVFEQFNIIGTCKSDYYNSYAYDQYIYIMSHSPIEYLINKYNMVKSGIYTKEYLFPFSRIDKGCDIILYGAGKVGQKFYNQIKKSKYCNIIGWVDQRADIKNNAFIKLPEQINLNSGDYVVIAVEDSFLAAKIKESLINDYKVNMEKIIWENPVVNC